MMCCRFQTFSCQDSRQTTDYVLRIFEAIPSRHCRDSLEGLIIRTMGAVPFTLHPKSLTRAFVRTIASESVLP